MTSKGMSAPLVDLDDEGDFKYVLIEAVMPAIPGMPKPRMVELVRGYKDCDFHAEVRSTPETREQGASCACLASVRLTV